MAIINAYMNLLPKLRKGFTLVELLIVIGILAVLLAIVLIALNPARQFSQANNTKRSSDVNAILNAIHQYAADNKGAIPAGVTTTDREVSAALANICTDLVPLYLAQLPTDPDSAANGDPVAANCPAGYVTGYNVVTSASDNRITVSAPSAELSVVISVTR